MALYEMKTLKKINGSDTSNIYPGPQDIIASKPGSSCLYILHHGFCILVNAVTCHWETHVGINTILWRIRKQSDPIPVKP